MLSSSGDDGCVRLWKANYLDSWKCIAEFKGDGRLSQDMERNQSQALQSFNGIPNPSNTTSGRYTITPVSNPNQVPWHWQHQLPGILTQTVIRTKNYKHLMVFRIPLESPVAGIKMN